MVEFWTRCPEGGEESIATIADYEYVVWECECHTESAGYVAWPQPCPDCKGGIIEFVIYDKNGERIGTEPCPAGCDGGRVWPQGWRVGHFWPHNEYHGEYGLFVPLEEP